VTEYSLILLRTVANHAFCEEVEYWRGIGTFRYIIHPIVCVRIPGLYSLYVAFFYRNLFAFSPWLMDFTEQISWLLVPIFSVSQWDIAYLMNSRCISYCFHH